MKNNLRSRWPLVFLIIMTLLSISYYLYTRVIYPVNRSYFVLGYGFLCLLLLLALTLYIFRKSIYSYRVGSQQAWLQSHIYIGIISLSLLLMHSGFRLTGTFSIFLAIIYCLTFISGIAGALIYRSVPLSLVKFGRKTKSEEELIGNLKNFLEEADSLVSKTSNELKKIYEEKIRPSIELNRTKWEYLFMEERDLLDKRRGEIEGFKASVLSQDIHDLNTLSTIFIESEKTSFVLAKMKIQEAWLGLHMPLTLALLTCVIIHIAVILYY
ncbi:MAG: hypothetical protein HY807_02190 [Nitrospirae bacterium]|nr:hypothetical protein [Nitrospirota bacterium]